MRLIRFLDEHGEKVLALWLYLFIVVVIFSEVLRRFVFSYSSLWGEETARYSFIYMVWIGAALAVKDRQHIRITILVDVLGHRAQNALSILAAVLGIGFAVLALCYSIEPFLTSIQYQSVTDGLRIVQAWYLFAVPFGFSLILLRFVQMLIEDLKLFIRGAAPASGAKLYE